MTWRNVTWCNARWRDVMWRNEMERCPSGEDMGHRPLREPMPKRGLGALSKIWNFLSVIGVWQGVARDSLKFHPCPTLLRLMVGPPLKQPYGRFRVRVALLQGGQPSSTSLDTPCHTAMLSVIFSRYVNLHGVQRRDTNPYAGNVLTVLRRRDGELRTVTLDKTERGS
jgi:hypothetical protein